MIRKMKKEAVNTIWASTDYDCFVFLAVNRKVRSTQHLKDEYLKRGRFLMPITVTLVVDKDENGNEITKYGIADGQHRFKVYVELKVPVIFQIVDNVTADEILGANNKVRTWKISDYTGSFSKQAEKDYEMMEDLIKRMKSFTSAVSAAIATAMNKKKSGQVNKIYKNGDFKFYNYEKYIEFINFIEELSVLLKCKINESLFECIYSLYTLENFDKSRFINKVFETKSEDLILYIKDRHILLEKLAVEIYNHKLSSSSRFYINYSYNHEKRILISSPLAMWASE